MRRVGSANSKRPGNPSATRADVAERSRALLIWLSQLPRLAVPVTMLVLMLVGLMGPLYAAIPALLIVAAFVIWLAYISWPLLDTTGRVLRGVMISAITVALVGRISGWL